MEIYITWWKWVRRCRIVTTVVTADLMADENYSNKRPTVNKIFYTTKAKFAIKLQMFMRRLSSVSAHEISFSLRCLLCLFYIMWGFSVLLPLDSFSRKSRSKYTLQSYSIKYYVIYICSFQHDLIKTLIYAHLSNFNWHNTHPAIYRKIATTNS